MTKYDLSGKTFGSWLVLSEGDRNPQGKRRWLCRCECGREKLVRQCSLIVGDSKSCSQGAKHGLGENTPGYGSWVRMLGRCNNPNNPRYDSYGGRGIKVCERWRTFANFYEDMGAPQDGQSLDRINNDGGYEPGNCRWATASQQQNNTRRTRIVEMPDGRRVPMTLLARELGLKPSTLRARLNRRGGPSL